MRFVRVSGTAYERGRQHGAACGDLIRRYVDLLLIQVNERRSSLPGQVDQSPAGSKVPSRLTLDVLRERALWFVPLFEEYAKQQLDEICGVADGAEVAFADALLVNVRGEVARDVSGDGCTSFALAPNTTASGVGALLGQNCDVDPEMDPLWVVLHILPDDGPQILMLTFGGLIGYHGINELGVAHGANSVSVGRWQKGLPHYPFKRLLLEQSDIASCITLARRIHFCSAANYVLADGNGDVVDLEIVPEQKGVHVIEPSEGVVVHTNHFLHPDLLSQDQLRHELPDSTGRLERFRELTARKYGQISTATLMTALADHQLGTTGICRHHTLKTAASFIADTGQRKLHACRGNPCCNTYHEYGFEA